MADNVLAIDALLAHEPAPHDPTQFLPMHAGKDAAADIARAPKAPRGGGGAA